MSNSVHQYSDIELLASARDNAFQGLLIITVLREHPELRSELRHHFAAILTLIDGTKE